MSENQCSSDENIVRAICDAHYDTVRNKASSALFLGTNISVSRLELLPLLKIVSIFQNSFSSNFRGFGQINIGTLQDIGSKADPPKELPVIADPTDENPAHAEIRTKITRGLAKRILRELESSNSITWDSSGE